MIVILALAMLATACADDPIELTTDVDTAPDAAEAEPDPLGEDEEVVPPDDTSTATAPDTSYPTTAPLEGTPTTGNPVTYPTTAPSTAYPTVEPLGPATVFEPFPVPDDVRRCSVEDILARGDWNARTGPNHQQLILANVSTSACGLVVGAEIADSDQQATSTVYGEWPAADPVLEPGEIVSVVLTSTPSTRTGQAEVWVTVDGVRLPEEFDGRFFIEPLDLGVAGPVMARPELVQSLTIVPPAVTGGTPLRPGDVVSLEGIGPLRIGMGLQEAADALGQVIVVDDWNLASSGCGFASIPEVDAFLYLAAPVTDGDPPVGEASIVAIETWIGYATAEGITNGSTFDDIVAAYGAANVERVPSEFADEDHARSTPTDPAFADRAYFFPWGGAMTSGVVTGLAEHVYRAEGCA